MCKSEQAREPALSAHTLGMKQLMVGASKMDSCQSPTPEGSGPKEEVWSQQGKETDAI